jgi:hypothetical protein
MRRICSIVACVAFFALGSPAARASQTGGLASPLGVGGLAVSATLGYGQTDVEDGRDDQVDSHKVLFRAEYGVADALDLYATLGLTDADFDHEDFHGSLGETLGAGVRYGLLNFRESALKLVLDLQGEYFRSKDGDQKVQQQAYHLAAYMVKEIGAAGRVGYIYPYGGLRVSYAYYNGSNGVDNYTAQDFVGVFGGLDYFVTPNVYFSGELHLFDETSFYMGVGYRL